MKAFRRYVDMWNSLEIAKLAVSLLTPLLVVLLGYWFNRRLKEIEQENQQRSQLYAKEQERIRDEIERRHYPHIEFTIECNFYGPQQGWYIAEFVIFARNTSLVRHEFKKITLRVRGMKQDEEPSLWEGHGDRLQLKHKLLETDIVPQNWNYIFVEPDVTQRICFISRIPADYRYIVAWAQFSYDQYTPHNIERLFEVVTTRITYPSDGGLNQQGFQGICR